MAYLTPEQLRLAIAPNAGAVAGTAASLPEAQLQEAIDAATAEVDGRLSTRYRVPFTQPLPVLVRTIVTGKAIYLATLQYRGSKDLAAWDPVVLRHQQVEALLKDLVLGRADLVEIDGSTAEAHTGGSGIGEPINQLDGVMFSLGEFGLGRGAYFEGRSRDGW